MTDARPMVLRSINLPPDMDDQLRNLAFVLRRPKADLIRFFVARGLVDMLQRLGTGPTEDTIQRVASELQSNDSSAAEWQASRAGATRFADLAQQAATKFARG